MNVCCTCIELPQQRRQAAPVVLYWHWEAVPVQLLLESQRLHSLLRSGIQAQALHEASSMWRTAEPLDSMACGKTRLSLRAPRQLRIRFWLAPEL